MKNLILPKTCRLKRIAKSETVFIQAGLASNKHWIISLAWLAGLTATRANRLTSFRKRVQAAQVHATMARLSDEKYPTYELDKIINAIDLTGYKPAAVKFYDGFLYGDAASFDKSFCEFSSGKSRHFADIEYSALAFLDSETQVLVDTDPARSANSPIVVMKNGEVVAAIAPLNPKKILDQLKNKGNKHENSK